MIRLKSLLKEGGQYEKFWWMDSGGKLHRVPNEGHAPFAAYYLSGLVANDPTINMGDVYRSMYNLGWVRVSMFGYMGVYGVHFNLAKGKKPTSIQRDTLVDIAKETGATEIIDDTNGGTYASAEDFWE